VFPNPLSRPPKAISHNRSGSNEVHGGSKAASGEVTLVLHRAVAARGRHVLRHSDGRCEGFIRGVRGAIRDSS
jgi:hypothetical protein